MVNDALLFIVENNASMDIFECVIIGFVLVLCTVIGLVVISHYNCKYFRVVYVLFFRLNVNFIL